MDQSHGAIIRAANETVLRGGRLDATDRFFTADYVVYGTEPDIGGGAVFIRRFVEKIHAAFSDLEVEVEVLVESGDRVAWQRTAEAWAVSDLAERLLLARKS